MSLSAVVMAAEVVNRRAVICQWHPRARSCWIKVCRWEDNELRYYICDCERLYLHLESFLIWKGGELRWEHGEFTTRVHVIYESEITVLTRILVSTFCPQLKLALFCQEMKLMTSVRRQLKYYVLASRGRILTRPRSCRKTKWYRNMMPFDSSAHHMSPIGSGL